MTDLEYVSQTLDGLARCPAPEFHRRFHVVLRRFRFVPAAERRPCAEAFERHAAGDARLGPYATFLRAMDRFLAEDLQRSLRLLTEARAVFVERDDAEGRGLCAMLIGAIYRTHGNHDLALTEAWEGYELLKASGEYPVLLAAAANSIGNIAFDMGRLDEALPMFEVTYAESTRAEDFYFAVYGLHGLGRIFLHQGRRPDAEATFHRALELAEAHDHPALISTSLTELATLHFLAGDLDEAETLSQRALAIRERHRLLAGAVTNALRIAEVRCRRSQWAAALPPLDRALELAEELRVKPKIAQVHRQLADLYEQAGDPERSLAHFKRFHQIHEEVEREDGARRLADARLVFEAEQTKKENAIIKAQKAEIQRQNRELQTTIDELTRARIGRKAKAMTLGLAVVLFIFQDAILRTALTVLASDNYFLLLGVKMAIIFSLAPINRGIERHLLRRVTRRPALQTAPAPA